MARTKRNIWLRKFTPSEEFVARKDITIAGRKFHAGEVFDKSLVNVRQLRLLYETRKLLLREPKPSNTPGDRRRTREAPIKVEASETKRAYTARHKSRGNWFVYDQDGAEVAGPLKKAEAQAKLKELMSAET